MNTVGKMTFDFHMGNEEFARSLYGRWDSFFAGCVEKVTDTVLRKYDVDATLLQIDRLDLDLGCMNEDSFEERFPVLLHEKLEEALLRYLKNPSGKPYRRISEDDYLFQVLCRFLLHGSLPWDIANKYKNVSNLFLSVLRHNGKRLKAFLQTYGHYTSLQRRLVYQLDDPELEKGIRLLVPGESVFICSYIRLLRLKYKALEQPSIRESDYRDTVWYVIYAYVLTNRSSYFNKKSFLAATIHRLAVHYNLTYEELLITVTAELGAVVARQSMPPELFLILEQLKGELSAKLSQQSATDYRKLYRLISSAGEDGYAVVRSNDEWEILVAILTDENKCRHFLRPMKEEAIVALVRIIVPVHSRFIIAYARTLDEQQEAGSLQGKAGSEFRLLKWQIIFPVLFENKGLSFNKKYFVWAVLKKVAAHYNLEASEVLGYICLHLEEFGVGTDFRRIFMTLWDEVRREQEQLHLSMPVDTSVQALLAVIKGKDLAGIEEIRLLADRLAHAGLRAKVVSLLTEEEHHRLISVILPSESYFILPYSAILDKQQTNNLLKGKVGSGYREIKWSFIYAVLFESRKQVFNHRYFVEKTLNRIAAHYNLTVKDLLAYFFQEKLLDNIAFPFDLVKVFEELKIAYRLDGVKNRLDGAKDKESRKDPETDKTLRCTLLLQQYFGREADCEPYISALAIHSDYVWFIDRVLSVMQLLDNYLRLELSVQISKVKVLQALLDWVSEYRFLNRKEVMGRLIKLMFVQLNEKKQRICFMEEIEKLSASDHLLEGQTEHIREENRTGAEDEEFHTLPSEPVYVNNAGIVLLAPYLPRLFSMLSLTENNVFTTTENQIKAVFLLQYVVFQCVNAPEHELMLNKILVGVNPATPLPESVKLTEEEMNTVESMLKSVLQNWPKLKNTSVAGFREAFLQREGKIEVKEEHFITLKVTEKAYDMLLDSIPWGFRTVKFSWMEKAIRVTWR